MSANFGSLGITGYSNADAAIDQNFGQMQASAIQSLGAQVRSDIDQIMTTRAVRQMVPALSQLRPGTDEFPQQAAAVIAQNPLALRHPAGKAAIELLGNAHVQAQREAMSLDRLGTQTDIARLKAENAVILEGMRGGTRKEVAEIGAGAKVEAADISSDASRYRTDENNRFKKPVRSLEDEERFEMQKIEARKASRAGRPPTVSDIKAASELERQLIEVQSDIARTKAKGRDAGELEQERDMLTRLIEQARSILAPGIPGLPQAGGATPTDNGLIIPGAPGPQTVKENIAARTVWKQDKEGNKWEYELDTKKPTGKYVPK